MTDDSSSGSTPNRPRSRREPVVLDQKPLSSSVEQSSGAITPTDDSPAASSEQEKATVAESINTPGVSQEDPTIVETDMSDTSIKVTPSESTQSTPPPKSGGAGGLLLAVVAGGLAGAAVSIFLPSLIKPTNDLEARLVAVEKSLVMLPSREDLVLAAQKADEAGSQSASIGARLTALEGRISGIANGAASEQPTPAQGETVAELTALRERVRRIDETLASSGQELSTTINQLRGVEQTIATLDPARVQSEQKAIAQRLSELETTLQDKLGQFDPNRIAALADTQAGEIARLATRMTAAEGAVNETARKALAASASNNEQLVLIARIAVIERLQDALDQGKPFVNELNTLMKLGITGAPVAALHAAANGIATPQSLVAPFTQAAATFEAESIPADASFVDKLAASASRIVRIRAINGEADATDIAGQIENFLKSNNAISALAAWERLPQSARDKTKALADTLQSRVNAQAALAALAQSQVQALDALAASDTAKGE